MFGSLALGTAARARAVSACALALVALPLGGQPSGEARRFEHRRHERLSCLECHGAGAEHRTIRVRTPRDCASCHHDPRRELACSTCHASGPGEPRRVTASISLPGAAGPVSRELTFRHEVHLAASTSLTCGDCHRTGVTLARDRECGSCHASHHTAKAECASCHALPRAGAHDARVHLSCAGSACHDAARAPPPALSRALCLVCHRAQATHEPGGTCAECHKVPLAGGAPRAGSRGGPDA